jgi:hypothetical protein
MKVWVVGRYEGETWQIQGVYLEQELAERHALPGWFIGPVEVNEPLPHDATEWPQAFIVQK